MGEKEISFAATELCQDCGIALYPDEFGDKYCDACKSKHS